jgi:immune inhibitor A
MTFRTLTRHILIIAIVAAVALAAAGPSAARVAPGPAAEHTAQGSDTLDQLQTTVIPPRDRIDLAERLLGVTDIPAPPTNPPAEYEIGDVVTFWADNLDQDAQFSVDAQLVYKTDHVYMFVEVGHNVDLAGVQRSADTFETIIRPEVHRVFGTEWLPGIDGDPHLTILHATNLGDWVAAYYGSSSQYPDEAVPSSNEREMFFVNLDTMGGWIGSDYYESVLAHEFQHMVHWNVDLNEDTWLNEGLSELSSMLTGYGPSGFAEEFLRQPDTQLNAWPEDGNRRVHYGAAFMFVAYFYDRYGEQATSTLVQDPVNGLDSVANTLQVIDARDPATGAPVGLVDLYGDWLAANRLMDTSVGDGRFGYSFPEIATMPQAAITGYAQPGDTSVAQTGLQWGAQYLEIPGGAEPQTLRFAFEGEQTVSIVDTQAHSGRYMWWSNRADESDTRLTRAFDLTGVDSATLNYWTWYHIEDLWDYAYVMVSTDDGATWTPLATPRTTTDDPHSNAYGPGYTGRSGGWVQESLDLSAYAGQEVLVRFEYITDDAVTQPGLIIDDISIPEIGYSYDVEDGDGGWVSQGWLRMDNVLPQRFLVQLVQPGDAAQPVTRLLGPDDLPQGEWTITVGGEMGDAVIVVSGLAPVTTEPARYRYSLTQ